MKKKSADRDRTRRGRERRASERAEVRLSMRVEAGSAGAARIVTESQNISGSGVYCHSSHFLAPLSKVQLTIVLPRTPGATVMGQELVKCDGIVVRCDQRVGDKSETPYELACMFTRLEPAVRQRFEEFVTWRNLQALRAALAAPAKAGKAVGRTARPTAKPTAVRKKAGPKRTSRTSSARGAAAKRTAAGAARPAARKTAKRSVGRAQR